MVLLMIPGLGFLYSGLARRKSALSMIWACMGSFSVIVFQWYFWGYSLAFSSSATNGFIGNLGHFGLMGTLGTPSPGSPLIPELLYSFYQVSFPSRGSRYFLTFIASILCYYSSHCRWCCCRTWPSHPRHGFHFLLGNTRILPDRMLGMEYQWLGIQIWSPRLRRRWTCRDWIRSFCTCILDGSGETSREDDVEFQTSQRVSNYPRYDSPVVWMVGFQRWIGFRCQSPRCYGLLELLLGCYVWLNHLVLA